MHLCFPLVKDPIHRDGVLTFENVFIPVPKAFYPSSVQGAVLKGTGIIVRASPLSSSAGLDPGVLPLRTGI